jgi:signal transduction histidine kinase
MRERLRFCGGMLKVSSTPNEGTEVAAEVVAVKRMAGLAST